MSTRRCEECGERGWTDDGWTCEGCSLWSHLGCEEPSTDEYDGSRWCGACWPEQAAKIKKEEAAIEAKESLSRPAASPGVGSQPEVEPRTT